MEKIIFIVFQIQILDSEGVNKMKNIDVSACVVTYNNENLIRNVLNSIISSKTKYNVQLFVVDNSSSDKTVKIIEEEFPEVILIKNKKNLGYGAAHNEAINESKAKYHLIINPDITFGENFIQEAIDYMETHPEVVMFNPDIRDIDGRRKYPVKATPRLHYILPRILKWNNKIFDKWRDEYTYRSKFIDIPFDIEVCSGSFMICKKKALDIVGGFDERYFLYYEDIDLSIMMRKLGKIQCNPNISVVHIGSRAAYHSKIARKYMIESMIKFYSKWGWKI